MQAFSAGHCMWCRRWPQCLERSQAQPHRPVLLWVACRHSPGSSRQATECWMDVHPAGLSAARWAAAPHCLPPHCCLARLHYGPCRDGASVSCFAAEAARQAAFRCTATSPVGCWMQGSDREPCCWAACYAWSGRVRGSQAALMSASMTDNVDCLSTADNQCPCWLH